MGVPKFFRWLSERYPKINQRYANLPNVETTRRHFPERSSPLNPIEEPDPMATCGLAPPIDRLYLDMNGIIHGCSHNNNEDENDNNNNSSSEKAERDTDASVEAGSGKSSENKDISREEIFRNVCYYLDRVIGDIVQPEQLVYMAIDGVAPRAKMNQQRSRRYRSGGEGEIETTIYEAHRAAEDEKERLRKLEEEEKLYDDDQSVIEEEWKGHQYKYNGSSYSFVLDADEGNTVIAPSIEDDEDNRRRNSTVRGSHSSKEDPNEGDLKEVTRGRFKGKFEAQACGRLANSSSSSEATKSFHSNEITPGTPFFAEFTKNLEHFVKRKLSTDPKWKNLTIIFSGPNVPGEGEHKIMQFLREQREQPDYDPNLRHCIMGQDGDLMMLGLVTHEPNMVLLREKVVFNMSSARLEKAHAAEAARRTNESSSSNLSSSLDTYIYNPHFEFLHLQVLRDYLAYEFETSNVLSSSPWDIERTIDDFVFMTFLIGNDFLPHLPALDIADQAFDLLYYTYKNCRKKWLEEEHFDPYLTHAGTIVSGRRLEQFFAAVGSHEVTYYEKKKQTADAETRRLRRQYKKLKMKDTLPDDFIVASKEEADRAAYRAMLQRMEREKREDLTAAAILPTENYVGSHRSNDDNRDEKDKQERGEEGNFVPVTTQKVQFQPIEDSLEEGLISRMGTLLQNSLSSSNADGSTGHQDDESGYHLVDIDDQDLKGRYYFDKFKFTPFDADKHRALRKAYMEGLVWNLKYYYEGCVSWNWFYPYHYGPMLSDLVELDEILDEISLEDDPGAPLDPFHQLMGCMPPSQAHHLPEPYRPLMTDPDSPIIDFYPNSFVVDMNGKRWPWEAVTLLPFIDSKRLMEATSGIDQSKLTHDELDRNTTGTTVVMRHDPDYTESVPGVGQSEVFQAIDSCKAVVLPFEKTDLFYTGTKTPIFRPEIKSGTRFPLPGFSTLRDAPIETLYRRRLGINVHGGKSRYKTASLEISSLMPPLPPVESLAPKLIGTTVFVNYPHFVEALVTAVSDEMVTVRGNADPKEWTPEESKKWKLLRDGVIRRAEVGEGYCGTGGLIVAEDQQITLSVRPFQGFTTTKSGQKVKCFAVFELDVPLISTFWAPSQIDPRLAGIPSRLERNAYEIAMSKNVNDPLLGGLSSSTKSGKHKSGGTKPKRRRLFPAKSSSNAKRNSATTQGQRIRANGRSKKFATVNYSSLHSGAHRDRNIRRDYSTSSSVYLHNMSQLVDVNTTPFAQTYGSSPLFYFQPSGYSECAVPNSYSTFLKPSQQMIPKNTRVFPQAFKPFSRLTSFSKSVSCSKSNARRLGCRGRIFAAGLALAACYLNPANATQNISPKILPVRKHGFATSYLFSKQISGQDALEAWSIPRGGEFEQSSSLNAFLPPQRPTPPLEFAHGTTTLSFTFQGGIIAAVDSRASLGQFVGSKTTQKVLPVNSHILGTMAGGAADCQHWIRKLKSEALLHQLTEDGRRMSVARASRILSNYLYALRGYDLSIGTMIMGYDDVPNGGKSVPYIYYVDNTGLRIQGDMFAVGSGSTFAQGILDSEHDRYNLTIDEAIALGIKAIRHATFRDAYSGGYINVYLITPKHGWKKVYTEDIARTPEVWKTLTEKNSDAEV